MATNNNYTIENLLGSGHFGKVYKAKKGGKGRGRPPAANAKKAGRPAKGTGSPKKETGRKSPAFEYYEDYELSTSESEPDAGAVSDESGDLNWRPYGEVRGGS